MPRACTLAARVCALLVCVASSAVAIPPPHVPDTELAKAPVVVVARWEGAAFERRGPYSTRTRIVVERVLHGKVEAGVLEIEVGFSIGWQPSGGAVCYFGSTEMLGDVDDVRDSNLWLLWDAGPEDPDDGESTEDTEDPGSTTTKDARPSYVLATYRGVQPLSLEPWFAALRSDEPEVEVPKLLSSSDAETLRRALVHVAGKRPWPFGDDLLDLLMPESERLPLPGVAPAVDALLDRPGCTVRGLAAAVLAELQGEGSLPRMRSLLGDDDPEVRAVALCVLAAHEDAESVTRFEQAAQGIESGVWGCKVVAALAAWGDPAVVPALIAFLQCDDFSYQYGDDYGVPALKARAALHALTGHWFPYDTDRARDAWRRVADTDGRDERLRLLTEILASLESPLVADFVSRDDGTRLRVRNRGGRPLTLAREPASLQTRASSGMSGSGFAPADGPEDFFTLEPGAAHEIPCEIAGFILRAEPETREASVCFRQNGNEWGLNAWIGVVAVDFGPDWKEPPRILVKVEERWPNGNLKVRGQTLNGTPYGTWIWYSEAGDRIRSEGGGGLTQHNPDHPANKGLGIPKKDPDSEKEKGAGGR